MTSAMTPANLHQNRLLNGLSDDQIKSFNDSGHTLTADAEDVLISMGDVNSSLYLVVEGELEVLYPEGPDRFEDITLARIKPGEYVGEYAFVDPAPSSATVRATQPSVLFRISHDEASRLVESEPDIGRVVYQNLLVNLVARLRESNEELDLLQPFS